MRLRQKKIEQRTNKFNYYSSSKEANRFQGGSSESIEKPGIRYVIMAGIIVVVGLLIANLYIDTSDVAVKVSQNGYGHSQEDYANKATELLQQNPFNKTKLSLDYNKVEQGIKESFPEVADVKITAPIIGSRITVNIILSEPALVMINDSGQFLVTRQGNATAEVNKGYEELPHVFDKSSVILESGQFALTGDQVKFILEIEKMFEQKGMSIERFELPGETTNQLSVKLSKVDYILKYSFSLDSKIQTGKYFSVLPTIEQGSSPKTYVDLRVGERAYVK